MHVAPPATALRDALAEKVLNAWLQNRQQTLFPLTVNLRTLDAASVGLLLQVAALAVSVGQPPDDARLQGARSWLASVGADTEHLLTFTAALDEPLAIGRLMQALQAAGLGAYAYAVSLAMLDQRDACTQPFLGFLASRLSVPPSVVQSVHRRSRGVMRA